MLGGLLGGLLSGGLGLLGASWQNTAADNAADEAWDRQKKMLTNQIQWRVQDATKAGLHPLAALGINPASGPAVANIGGGDLGAPLAQMGQDVGDAISRFADPAEKTAASLAKLQLERGSLENDLLRQQIASQRMKNLQQRSPGIAGGLQYPDGSLVPGDNKMGSKAVVYHDGTVMKVGQPGVAQQMADNYGDIVQELYGMYRLGVDYYNQPQIQDAIKSLDWLAPSVPVYRPDYSVTEPDTFNWGY